MTESRPEALPQRRDRPVDPARTALVLIDVQNMVFNEGQRANHPYFYARVSDSVLPNLRRLIEASRAAGAEVMYTVMENLTRDGRDRSLDYKLSNLSVAKGSWEARVVDAVAPGEDDIVLAKTSSSLFNSTNFDYVLRNIGIEALVVTGFLTDQCVDHTIRDGADRGYYVTCVSDACATYSEQRHEAAVSLFAGYCRTTTTEAMVEELRAACRRGRTASG